MKLSPTGRAGLAFGVETDCAGILVIGATGGLIDLLSPSHPREKRRQGGLFFQPGA